MLKLFHTLLFSVSFIYAQPQSHTFIINNETRQYYLYTPDSLGPGVPLLFVLHGYSGSAVSIMNYSNMNLIADENGFVVCYPQGLIDDTGYAFWNVGYSFHPNETVDDVEFLSEIISEFFNLYFSKNLLNNLVFFISFLKSSRTKSEFNLFFCDKT